ncbi:MAG TPA: hypothetical protein VF209_03935 [Patescibacteria group bacterium]
MHHSNDKADFSLAFELAGKAVKMGSKASLWLYAATCDRLLISQGKKQKFGTQYKYDATKSKYVLFPTDETISDEERLKHGVKPLEK